MLPDLTPIIYFAIIGMVAVAVSIFVGIPWLVWVLAHHLAWL